MTIKTISEEGAADFEIWTCDYCGHEIMLEGVGGDVCECPECLKKEYERQ